MWLIVVLWLLMNSVFVEIRLLLVLCIFVLNVLIRFIWVLGFIQLFLRIGLCVIVVVVMMFVLVIVVFRLLVIESVILVVVNFLVMFFVVLCCCDYIIMCFSEGMIDWQVLIKLCVIVLVLIMRRVLLLVCVSKFVLRMELVVVLILVISLLLMMVFSCL